MFVYEEWENFCRRLSDKAVYAVTAEYLLKRNSEQGFVVLKHDVETNPKKALKLALIEHKYGHKGTYYVQAYLLKQEKNIKILRKIQDMGHEVSYHHDVMDSNAGDLKKAEIEFISNCELFRKNGFEIRTVCQHGNPIVKREGYHSNRDFFRNSEIENKFQDIAEIMVNYKARIKRAYMYISDAGYGWKLIFDPENNDIIDTEDKDIKIATLEEVEVYVDGKNSLILSVHPHRWSQNEFIANTRHKIFTLIKKNVKQVMRISVVKKILEKFYFLAKKI